MRGGGPASRPSAAKAWRRKRPLQSRSGASILSPSIPTRRRRSIGPCIRSEARPTPRTVRLRPWARLQNRSQNFSKSAASRRIRAPREGQTRSFASIVATAGRWRRDLRRRPLRAEDSPVAWMCGDTRGVYYRLRAVRAGPYPPRPGDPRLARRIALVPDAGPWRPCSISSSTPAAWCRATASWMDRHLADAGSWKMPPTSARPSSTPGARRSPRPTRRGPTSPPSRARATGSSSR